MTTELQVVEAELATLIADDKAAGPESIIDGLIRMSEADDTDYSFAYLRGDGYTATELPGSGTLADAMEIVRIDDVTIRLLDAAGFSQGRVWLDEGEAQYTLS